MHGHGDIRLRTENCCESHRCMKPACYGALCASCFMAASPARRAVEMLAQDSIEDSPERLRLVSCEGVAWLKDLWAA